MVEALAFWDALSLAKPHRIMQFIVEGDSEIVIDSFYGKCTTSWRIKTIFEDIKWLASSLGSVEWNHVFRKTNFTAYVVTFLEHNCNNLYLWVGCVPPKAKNALLYGSRDLRC